MNASKPQCCAIVRIGRCLQSCKRAAKFERDGLQYCGTHDPVAAKAREDERYSEYMRKFEMPKKPQDALAAANARIAELETEILRLKMANDIALGGIDGIRIGLEIAGQEKPASACSKLRDRIKESLAAGSHGGEDQKL